MDKRSQILTKAIQASRRRISSSYNQQREGVTSYQPEQPKRKLLRRRRTKKKISKRRAVALYQLRNQFGGVLDGIPETEKKNLLEKMLEIKRQVDKKGALLDAAVEEYMEDMRKLGRGGYDPSKCHKWVAEITEGCLDRKTLNILEIYGIKIKWEKE